jgi:hypothetical protein
MLLQVASGKAPIKDDRYQGPLPRPSRPPTLARECTHGDLNLAGSLTPKLEKLITQASSSSPLDFFYQIRKRFMYQCN